MRRKYESRLRELHGISAASIADELGLQERTVIMLQRKLGLRACRPPGDRNRLKSGMVTTDPKAC